MFDPERNHLVGRRQRRVIRLGDKVEVQIAKVDSFKKQVDFRLATNRAAGTARPAKASASRPKISDAGYQRTHAGILPVATAGDKPGSTGAPGSTAKTFSRRLPNSRIVSPHGRALHSDAGSAPHQRRKRYAGRNPRRFEEKYKEHDPQRYADTVAKVLASGKTPAGTHRPIMVAEILEVLAPQPGEVAVDCTLGYGGHAQEILARIQPGGRLLGLDADPIELPKTEARLRALGFGPDIFTAHRSNFAGLPQVLAICSGGLVTAGTARLICDGRRPPLPAPTSSSPTSAFPRCRLTTRRAAFP